MSAKWATDFFLESVKEKKKNAEIQFLSYIFNCLVSYRTIKYNIMQSLALLEVF